MIFTTLKITKKPSNKLRSVVSFLYKYYIPGIAWGVLVTYLSLSAASSFKRFEFDFIVLGDIIVHFFLYLIWFILICRQIIVTKHSPEISSAKIIFIGSFLLSYGILMELMQKYLTDDRQFACMDILSNAAGILIAALLLRIFKTKLNFQK